MWTIAASLRTPAMAPWRGSMPLSPLCKALRGRADNSRPKPADRPSAACKQWEPMARAVILCTFTLGLDDQGNTVFSNLPEPIWWRRERIQEVRSRTRHPALLCGRTALYWLGFSHPSSLSDLVGD